MPSIDTNEVFAELNCSFNEQYNYDARPDYHNGTLTIPQFCIWYNCEENYNMEVIINSWVEQIQELVKEHYMVEMNYEGEGYIITFSPDIAMPSQFECVIKSDMGVVEI